MSIVSIIPVDYLGILYQLVHTKCFMLLVFVLSLIALYCNSVKIYYCYLIIYMISEMKDNAINL